jgi:hypothetical protein
MCFGGGSTMNETHVVLCVCVAITIKCVGHFWSQKAESGEKKEFGRTKQKAANDKQK